MKERLERLNYLVTTGRMTQGAWGRKDRAGRETFCLLSALCPETLDSSWSEAQTCGSAARCPPDVMPAWFAALVVFINDGPSRRAYPEVVRRFSACAAKWQALDDAAWRRVEDAALWASLTEASLLAHPYSEQIKELCNEVKAWIYRGRPEEGRFELNKRAWAREERSSLVVRAVTSGHHNAAEWAATVAGGHDTSAAEKIVDRVLHSLEVECGLAARLA